jgi:FecR protein
VFNERFTTGPLGQTQLLFLDESAMTIGPNSDLTIDQFVYDPKSGTGHLAMSASRGLLRFVGGKLSKQEEGVSLRTSTATLAVRGGAFLLDLTMEGRMEAIFIYGRTLTVTGAGGVTQTLSRPGYAIGIAGAGGAPSAPFPVPPGQIAQLVGHLDGRVGATGGAPTVPSDATVARSGVAATISGDVAGSVQQATQAQPAPQVQTVSVSALQSSANIGTVQGQGSSVVQQAYTSPTPSGSMLGTTTMATTTTNFTSNYQLPSPPSVAGPDILPRPPSNQNFVTVLIKPPR